MENFLLLKGMIQGMEEMGATFIKTDGSHLYFEIPKGGQLDNEAGLKRAKDAFVERFNLGIKIRKT